MKKITLYLIVGGWLWGLSPSIAQVAPIEVADFLQNAISQGLQKDRFPRDLAQTLLDKNQDFFVPKCPICTPVKAALRQYMLNSKSSKKSKTPAKLIADLNSNNQLTQHLALRDLIARYTQKYYQTQKFSPQQKVEIEQKLAEARKRGMGLKSSNFGEFCPSCEGANLIKY